MKPTTNAIGNVYIFAKMTMIRRNGSRLGLIEFKNRKSKQEEITLAIADAQKIAMSEPSVQR